MNGFFTWVGVFAVLILSFAAVLAARACWYRARHWSYYDGLRAQMRETAVEIEKEFGEQDQINSRDVAWLIMHLHNRRTPDIRNLKFRQDCRDDDERYARTSKAEQPAGEKP